MALVDTKDLEKALAALMKRKGVTSWLKTAFDAQDIEWLIADVPEIDAEPVRRGQWKEDAWVWHCNLCDKWFDVAQGGEAMNYCPNCGAKMYEEEEDNG